jgi:hypothetical protein
MRLSMRAGNDGGRGQNGKRQGAIMTYIKAIAGALAIMAGAGMITDFDLTEKGREIHIKVWATGPDVGDNVHQEVSALLSRYGGGRPIVVTGVA